MRSQRLGLVLLFLLVLSLMVAAALGARMTQLQRALDEAAGEQELREQEQEQQRLQLQKRNEQLRNLERDLDDAERNIKRLEGQINSSQQLQQERDELKSQLEQERQRANQLQQQLDNLQSMNQINGEVLAERGLQPRGKLPRTIISRATYRDHLIATIDESFPAEEEQRQRAKLLALDMITPDVNLREEVIDGQASSVLGYYDPATDELFVISDRGQLGVEDRVTYAHEYTHYLQDQAFGLDGLMGSRRNSDEALALRALVEGDAVLTMERWADRHLTINDKLNRELDRFNYLADAMRAGWGDSGGAVVESIGAFPYSYGSRFVLALYRGNEGWATVNRMYQDPPRSTAQVLHPELYGSDVRPVDVALPELAARLGPGWRQVDNDVLGELYLRVYLQHEIDVRFDPASIYAAEGWRGDRYAVLEGPDGARALAIRVMMASDDEARELFETYQTYIANKSNDTPPQLSTPSMRQWQLADRQVYLAARGQEVLILHGNDGATLERLKQAFPGF